MNEAITMKVPAAEPIPEAGDVVDRIEAAYRGLMAVARMLQHAKGLASEERNLIASTLEATLKLAFQAKEYSHQLAGLDRRRIEGLTIGYDDPSGRRWYLFHPLHPGNLMVCNRVEAAALWPDMASLRAWCDAAHVPRGEDAKGKAWPAPIFQLDEHDLHAYPVEIVVGEGTLIRRKIEGL